MKKMMTRVQDSIGGNRRISSAASLGLGWLLCVGGVYGQHTEAKCSVSSLSWSFNSLKQSPCLVAAYMANSCSTSGNYDVPALASDEHYTPSDAASLCECSTVTYSLLGACAACQGAAIDPWSDYITNCSKTSPDGEYAFQVPSGTAVPAWAYQLVTRSNRFNVTLAKSVGDQPENTTSSTPTTSSSSSSSPLSTTSTSSSIISGGGPPSSTSSGAGPTNTAAKSTPVGAIVGGVVGGVVGLGLIGAGMTFFLLRSKRNMSSGGPSGQNQYMTQPFPDRNGAGPVSMSVSGSPPLPSSNPASSYKPVNPVISSKPYDPEDPSTFPPTPGPNWSTGEPSMNTGRSSQPLASEYNNREDTRAEI